MTHPSTPTGSDETSWFTPAGRVRKGMKVVAADGSILGTVTGLDGEELFLDGGEHEFVATTQIDGISEDTVLLAPRGDATFGLGAQP